MAITITLSPEQEQFVTSVIGDGQYASASDVVAEALLALESQQAERQEEEREFREFVEGRIEEAKNSKCYSDAEVAEHFRAKAAAWRARGG
ncbi:MAG: type II toxin-antitoxin system ParD family antitoxin [Acidobacteria bacterium]|nr:type II toxin-antitoxin system ParD family antitoxin [Acidobacteriota bacterium]MBM3768698.1 type II toxin-antitoxin system ParD family antitoxin [Acidobacteriota bacterium]